MTDEEAAEALAENNKFAEDAARMLPANVTTDFFGIYGPTGDVVRISNEQIHVVHRPRSTEEYYLLDSVFANPMLGQAVRWQ